MVYLLSEKKIGFPDPRNGEENGLFAVGGDLSVERLLLAYSYGIFPWYAFRPEDNCKENINPKTGKPYIEWWCPMRRFVIFTNEIHISHSMRQELKKLVSGEISVTYSTAFEQVIEACSSESCGTDRDSLEGAWLGEDMKKAYIEMFKQGYAASIEVWDKDLHLIGGLYGLTLGYGFFGESMFSLKPNASKIALIVLAKYLESRGITLIDCQLETPHLRSMGGRFIPYDEYLKIIRGE